MCCKDERKTKNGKKLLESSLSSLVNMNVSVGVNVNVNVNAKCKRECEQECDGECERDCKCPDELWSILELIIPGWFKPIRVGSRRRWRL